MVSSLKVPSLLGVRLLLKVKTSSAALPAGPQALGLRKWTLLLLFCSQILVGYTTCIV